MVKMVSALPSQLGRYKVLDEIGRGAMGVVYLARDPLIGRLVALKTFRISAALSGAELDTFRARFIREAQSAGILSHPNIVTIHDVVEESEEGATFIAMEYVRGTDLKETLAKERKLDLDAAVDVVSQVAEGLDYAHAHGVVHRDVKPANILITEDRHVKLTDFGIARIEASNLTMEGQLLGTPNYMAPEQIQGLETDHRVDVFSLGVVLYEMLTGEKPFKGDNVTVVTHRIVYDEYSSPEEYIGHLPEPVMEVIDRALAKEPNNRYGGVGEMAEDLRTGVARLRTERVLNETQVVIPVAPRPPGETDAPSASGATSGPGAGERLASTASRSARAGWSAMATLAGSLGSTVLGWSRRAIPPGANRPSPVRLALVAGVALAVGVLLGGLLLAGASDGESLDQVTETSPEHRQRVAAHPYLVAAHQELRAGDPAAALGYLEAAERVGPDLREVRLRRRQVAEQAGSLDELEEHAERIARGLVEARTAAEAGRWTTARAAAAGVLEIEPENQEAGAIVKHADAGLAARTRRQERQALDQAAEEAEERLAAVLPEPEPEARALPAPEPTGEAGLDLHFYTELPEGVLTVYFGRQQITREDFRFFDRKFLRLVPKHGEIANSYTVKPGEATVRILVALPGRPTITKEMNANFPDGTRRRLELRLHGDRTLSARIE